MPVSEGYGVNTVYEPLIPDAKKLVVGASVVVVIRTVTVRLKDAACC